MDPLSSQDTAVPACVTFRATDPRGRTYQVSLYQVHPGHWEYTLMHNGKRWDSIDTDNGVEAQWARDAEDAKERAIAEIGEIDTNRAYNERFQEAHRFVEVWAEFRMTSMRAWSKRNRGTAFAEAFLSGKIWTGFERTPVAPESLSAV